MAVRKISPPDNFAILGRKRAMISSAEALRTPSGLRFTYTDAVLIAAALPPLPAPVKPMTFSTSGSCRTMAIISTSFFCMVWNETD